MSRGIRPSESGHPPREGRPRTRPGRRAALPPAEQATAAQKQEAALRSEATRTVEELRALIQQQELAIERLQQQSAARPASPASRSGPGQRFL